MYSELLGEEPGLVWLTNAALANYAHAQLKLAQWNEAGKAGLMGNDVIAAKYYRLAAEQGTYTPLIVTCDLNSR
jgi:TPR repeat protein